ncbi:FtsW/RodA/SpoVE family cell cycle protein [Mammaliicoccus sciuri]|uniref:FtsW/RodA/SpoVE family cell cycle protein n=1 Tax=Mammaliicoccus sciuri TaxID=1296 RepID=UPI000470FD31|nr:FtsW/RodA/SpoVE family cell cycle protein [Mammaliicoccus sciuri]MCJ0911503.1 FtsW/RodA/SpoVE family cell cycle protein [Mammaliicoccus sciuri]MCJ0966869.1 FtsW/RodA/SpoVE family cell cycle protein [Mammaliicoccus sciuri]MEB5649641.1 FtsW/RodA/SpoVE family cell cycle protein [Mammaliicoccus sciuri]MEB6338757.1 FtsW/RodA/SpoVE family cell cycle protein [Mammaliicoccus sciuri]MEB6341677.1 FtsW/RodA/SpoVE family cell cycle protein [Mammaliicoccus sciuri]
MEYIKRFFQYIKNYSKYIDFTLLITYIILSFIGLVMVYSASMVAATKGTLTGGIPVSGTYFFVRQLLYCIVGFFIVFFMSYFMHINVLKNKRVQQIVIFTIFGLLVLTLLVGTTINGAKSWINLGFMNLQASEILKVAMILYLSFIIDKRRNRLKQFKLALMMPLFLIGTCIGLVLLQNDTGQALILCMIVLCIFAYSGIGIKAILKWSGPIFAGVVLLIIFSIVFKGGILSQHQADRFHVLENPFNYESGIGYHLANSLLAIGNGGLFGKGLGNGIMKLGYLPEPHTDFIFAVIAEELGLVGVLFIIGLLGFIVYKGFLYAALTDSYFFKLVCVGISSYIGIQTFVNLAGISGTIPLTGVPLPFMTFGGSSMLSLSIATGILLLTAKQIRIESRQRAR